MLAFFKSPKSLAASENKTMSRLTLTIESTPVQDAPNATDSIDQAEGRVSSASIPTIDSAPTIQGLSPDAPQAQSHSTPLSDSPNLAASLAPPSPADAHGSAPSVHTQSSSQSDRPMQSQSQSALPYSPSSTVKDPRRFSFPSFSFLRSDAKQNKLRSVPPLVQTQPTSASKAPVKKSKTSRALSCSLSEPAASSEKRAKESAAIVRSVIVGHHNTSSDPKSNKSKPISKHDMARVKSQLLDPKTAAKVISHLRALPAHPNDSASNANVPIHAVCLDMLDKDIYEQYFSRFEPIATASLSTVSTVLADVHLIDLLTAPDMGIGAPVTAQGLFAGALPTAETVIEGIEQITPQLMALGYATGKAILPDHKGIIVPTDRISVLAYWWGFEVCLPPPTIAFLEAAESPGSALLGLLTAISLLNPGVREIIPFIRYIAQFVQCEWNLVKRVDGGKGVVCTATWVLPVALVPRAWDFPDPPLPHTEMGTVGQSTPTSPSINRFSATLATPKPSTEAPNGAPRSSSAFSAETKDEEDSRHVISSEPPVLPELVVSSPGSIDSARPGSAHREASAH
ncbi:hypothetical protein JVT61DRAFT_13745 [Boletus reticuloceps]|uniref:Uncharacterized protein n=1 Tax=Boletus reticuloceps TaxID=495285 RepID=A0A8I3AC44_9AGAM|nr:hypothetical protein JVT61DRAFT_13745 [Boletus reticuloceps]